jgi:hypothetical protein
MVEEEEGMNYEVIAVMDLVDNVEVACNHL